MRVSFRSGATYYELLGDPIFRERPIPRMTTLDTARAPATIRSPRSLGGIQHAAGPASSSDSRSSADLPRRLDSADCPPPIRGGWVSVENGLITGTGADAPRGSVDLGDVAVLPALVNAHTHLELSYLRGRVARAGRFLDWIRAVVAARRGIRIRRTVRFWMPRGLRLSKRTRAVRD